MKQKRNSKKYNKLRSAWKRNKPVLSNWQEKKLRRKKGRSAKGKCRTGTDNSREADTKKKNKSRRVLPTARKKTRISMTS